MVDAARQALGPVGVVLPVSFTVMPSVGQQRDAVTRLERAGYRAVWTNEVIGGKDVFTQLAVLSAATERMVFGTSIANIWTRLPQTAHGAAALLTQAYPGRFVLGLGVGYPQQAAQAGREFGSPLATMRDYVARMSAETWPPAPDVDYPRIIAANGPKMLALAGEIADGAVPAMHPPEFTRLAREILGPDKLLVMGLPVVPEPDPGRAREIARETVSALVSQPAYAASLARLGYPAQEIAEVGDRLVRRIVAQGTPEDIASQVRQHLSAGADHVKLMVPTGGDFTAGVDQFERLAPALTEIA